MMRALRWLLSLLRRPTRVYQGKEMYGPFVPWSEVLRQSTSRVPRPKETP